MIYANVSLTLQKDSMKADKNIVLYRGDKNVEIRFIIKGNNFVIQENTYAQMVIRRPSARSIFSEPALIQDNTVIFTITEDMIDELKELGGYTFQIRLYDDNMVARATLPPCEGCLRIERPIAVEGESAVNIAMVNYNAVMAAEFDDNTLFNDDGSYYKVPWIDGDLISDTRMNKIENALYELSRTDITQNETIEWLKINGGGGSGPGGGITAANLSSNTSSEISLETGKDVTIDYRFTSPNIGDGTLKVFVNDIEILTKVTPQGSGSVTIYNTNLTKGLNRVTMYVIDRGNTYTNILTFNLTYGSLEIESTFDTEQPYEIGATIRFYFTPRALSALDALTFHMSIDGVEETMACNSGVRATYTFPRNLTVGSHNCRAWITNDKGGISNILTFSLVILDAESLVVSTSISEATAEEGRQISLDYKASMQGQSTFNTFFYVNNELVNTGTTTLVRNYWNISTLPMGAHILKLVVKTLDEQYTAEVQWTVTITQAQYSVVRYTTAGLQGAWTAYDMSNTSTNRAKWVGVDEDGDTIEGALYNYSFGSNSGWIDDGLLSTGDSYAMLPVKPLVDNARYGFTFDIEFYSTNIGNSEATVVKCWDDEDDCGFKITTENIILKSKAGNELNINYSDSENTSVTFVIDRDNKQALVYLNGVITQAFYLSDYITDGGTKVLEDFTVNDYVYVGNVDHVGWNSVKNLRMYQIALSKEEVLQNFISNEKNVTLQQALSLRQEGAELPVMTITADFNGIGKDDAKNCSIRYISPNSELYGDSFELNNNSTVQWQGTSSLVYAIKNYKIKLKDDLGNKFKYNPYNDGAPESTFCLKADYMESSHSHNTGLAKFINKYLYDGLTLNPARQVNPKLRDTINGFPIRLVLKNIASTSDGISSSEPIAGETKDMGIFNFNLDKGSTDSLGFDVDEYPRCKSYEVAANSDVSAGAFVAYKNFVVDSLNNGAYTPYIPISFFGVSPGQDITCTNWIQFFNASFSPLGETARGATVPANTMYIRINGGYLPNTIQGKTISLSDATTNEQVQTPYSDPQAELEYLKSSFELRYPDSDDYGEDYGFMDTEYGLKRIIDKVDSWDVTTPEGILQMKQEFEDYFDLGYTLRYLLCTLVFAQVDNLGKNMMLTTWDGQIWYPQFYDLDTCLSLNNSGQIKIDVDAEIEEGVFNTSNSNLWKKLQIAYEAELKEQYRQMRSGKFNLANIMEFLYGEQISKIPQSYYNKDAQIKYLDFENQYLDKLHGDQYEHMKQWLTDRILYVDTLLDYTSTTDDAITVRANTLNTITFDISTYTPQYLRIKWKNGVVEKQKIDGKNPTRFVGTVDAATDQEILIYNASKIRQLDGLSSANPNSLDLAYATKLQSLTINDAPLLTTINGGTSGGVNLNTLTYLNYLNLRGCTNLPNAVVLNRCPLISYVNVQGTSVNDVQLYPGSVSLKEIWYPTTIQLISLSDLPKLTTVGLEERHSCKELRLINCPNINAFGDGIWSSTYGRYLYDDGWFLSGIQTLYIDGSYLNSESLRIQYPIGLRNITLLNMPNLESIKLGVNSETTNYTVQNNKHMTYDYVTIIPSLDDISISTSNTPKLKTFYSTGYGKKSFEGFDSGPISGTNNYACYKMYAQTSDHVCTTSNFRANVLDLSGTQIENAFFYVATQLNGLKLPTTVKKLHMNNRYDLKDGAKHANFDRVYADVCEQRDNGPSAGDTYLSTNNNNRFYPSYIEGSGAPTIIANIWCDIPANAEYTPIFKEPTWNFDGLGEIEVYNNGCPICYGNNGYWSTASTLENNVSNGVLKNAIIKSTNFMMSMARHETFENVSLDYTGYTGRGAGSAFTNITDEVDVTLPSDTSSIGYYYRTLVNANTSSIRWSDPFVETAISYSNNLEETNNIILAEQGPDERLNICFNKMINGAAWKAFFKGSNLKYVGEWDMTNVTTQNLGIAYQGGDEFPVEVIDNLIINGYCSATFLNCNKLRRIKVSGRITGCWEFITGATNLEYVNFDDLDFVGGGEFHKILHSGGSKNVGSVRFHSNGTPMSKSLGVCYGITADEVILDGFILNGDCGEAFASLNVPELTVHVENSTNCGSMFNNARIGHLDLNIEQMTGGTCRMMFANAVIDNLTGFEYLPVGATNCEQMFQTATINGGSLPDPRNNTACTTMDNMFNNYKGPVKIPSPFIVPATVTRVGSFANTCRGGLPETFVFDCSKMAYTLNNGSLFQNSNGLVNLTYKLPKQVYTGSVGATSWSMTGYLVQGSPNVRTLTLDWSAFEGSTIGLSNMYNGNPPELTFNGIAWDKFGAENLQQAATLKIKGFSVYEPAYNTNINVGSWRFEDYNLISRFIDEALGTLDCANLVAEIPPENAVLTNWSASTLDTPKIPIKVKTHEQYLILDLTQANGPLELNLGTAQRARWDFKAYDAAGNRLTNKNLQPDFQAATNHIVEIYVPPNATHIQLTLFRNFNVDDYDALEAYRLLANDAIKTQKIKLNYTEITQTAKTLSIHSSLANGATLTTDQRNALIAKASPKGWNLNIG